jgi:hypothetical protein
LRQVGVNNPPQAPHHTGGQGRPANNPSRKCNKFTDRPAGPRFASCPPLLPPAPAPTPVLLSDLTWKAYGKVAQQNIGRGQWQAHTCAPCCFCAEKRKAAGGSHLRKYDCVGTEAIHEPTSQDGKAPNHTPLRIEFAAARGT